MVNGTSELQPHDYGAYQTTWKRKGWRANPLSITQQSRGELSGIPSQLPFSKESAPSQRHVARRLQHCADASDAFASAARALQSQRRLYVAQKSRAEELSRLRVALAQLSQVQALSAAEMGVESDPQQVMSLLRRTDRILRAAGSTKKPAAQRTEKVVKRLPRLMKRATSMVLERRQMIKEKQELPTKFQWVPMVLWRLYDDVRESAKEQKEFEPMKTAMHHVMKTVKDLNPFFYLQVLYQPPPQHLHGQWEISASDQLKAIAKSMTPFLRELKRRSLALKNTYDPYTRIHHGWDQLRVTLAFARRAARHFHFLMLYLYAVAMGCDSPNVHAGIISEKAMSGMLREDAELRSRLQLCRESAYSEDNLIKEAYEWTPELLVYLDEWRRHRATRRTRLGFDRGERHYDFLPQFLVGGESARHGRKKPRRDVLSEIGSHLSRVYFAWRASKLGTAKFKSMRIKDLGKLEIKIKRSLSAVVELVYSMILARWMDRRKRSIAWWESLELREVVSWKDGFEKPISNPTSQTTIESNYDDNDARCTSNAESVEQKRRQRAKKHLPSSGRFRRPSKVLLGNVVANASRMRKASDNVDLVQSHFVAPHRVALDHIIRLCDIYAWTDEDIDFFHRDAKRIGELQAVIFALRDQLDWSKASSEIAAKVDVMPSFGDLIKDDWCVSCAASHLCSLTAKAVTFAEETAMHGAAVALTQRPSLRCALTGPVNRNEKLKSSGVSIDPTLQELQESVHDAQVNVAELLAPYDGAQMPEWRDLILSTGQGIVQLLRFIAQDDFLREEKQGPSILDITPICRQTDTIAVVCLSTAYEDIDATLGPHCKIILLSGYVWDGERLCYMADKSFGLGKMIEDDGTHYLVLYKLRWLAIPRRDLIVIGVINGDTCGVLWILYPES
ncbi:unnamed protein product [Phytophthora fragariaefolia]|uniref:Unnamed protein product n=1 Tax=Phytophthora fragariaefolia TaxID=1490495 RepID=A0A9W6XIW3_9STRA|nr:unnamed protein product [Phytophthora fragariaefolia]